VSRRARITLPDLTADRPRPLGALAIALCALCAGVASAYGARGLLASTPEAQPVHGARTGEPASVPPRTATPLTAAERETETIRTPPSPDAGTAIVTVSDRAATDAGSGAAQPARAPAQGTAEATSIGTAATDARSALQPAAPLRFTRGYVAYLRCDGLPQGKGPFPCPRDRALEQQAWDALSALEHCELAQRPGRSEVRFDFESGARAWTATGTLERSAVVRCAGAALSHVNTSLRPTRMIVSFRFELR
jgi:hypothetical protein